MLGRVSVNNHLQPNEAYCHQHLVLSLGKPDPARVPWVTDEWLLLQQAESLCVEASSGRGDALWSVGSAGASVINPHYLSTCPGQLMEHPEKDHTSKPVLAPVLVPILCLPGFLWLLSAPSLCVWP